MRRLSPPLLIALLGLFSAGAQALDRVYLAPEQFIAQAFSVKPAVKVLWLTPEIQAQVTRILGHPPMQLRQHYWSDGKKTAWILEEVGKEEPITAGFVVSGGKIVDAKVLVYRESRGMEVRLPAFLSQFLGISLSAGNRLDRPIDGISGATLSVGAMERMAREALYFDRVANGK